MQKQKLLIHSEKAVRARGVGKAGQPLAGQPAAHQLHSTVSVQVSTPA